MRTIIGTAVGVILLGLVLIGVGLRGVAAPELATGGQSRLAEAAAAAVPPDTRFGGVREDAAARPVLVNCGPGQRALVRPVVVQGQMVSEVECVAGVAPMAQQAAAAWPQQHDATVVSEMQPAPDTGSVRVVRQPRVDDRAPAPRRTSSENKRGWKKPLLIIGGSTAAGAGVGGLVGGKKGALIGAALGGGASTIYEATRK